MSNTIYCGPFENIESLPNVITLYHGTSCESLDSILEEGVMDATKGKIHGETSGMNWFSLQNVSNFNRGAKFCIDINKEEFLNGTFRFMNEGQVVSYKPISINDKKLEILSISFLQIDEILNILKKNNYDPIDWWNEIKEILYDFNEYYVIDDVSCNIPIQILRQIGKNNLISEYGLSESIIYEISAKDINLQSFEMKDELNPKFWVNNKLNSRVRLRLLDIVNDYMKNLAVDWVEPKDVVLTGSIANYNWSKYSDVDIHILMDYSKVYKKTEFVEDYFKSKKDLWNQSHENLKIYGFPIEIFVEDINADSCQSGIYSLNKNKWVVKPTQMEDGVQNEAYVKKISARLINQIDEIEEKLKKEKDIHRIEVLSTKIKKIWDKVKGLRKEGLKSKYKEMSSGNIIYKVLRRTNYLDKIWEIINTTYNKVNTIKENKEIF